MASGSLSDLVYPELKTTGRLELGSMATAFRIWRHKLDFVLADKKLKYVFTDPIPDKEKDPFAHQKFLDDDSKAQGIILFRLDDSSRLHHYERHDSAKSLLDALTSASTQPSMTRRMILLRQYLGRKMFDEMPVREHVLNMRAMAKELELELEGVKIPDEFQAVVLINSLPDSWEDAVERMVVSIDSDAKELSLEDVEDKVRAIGGWKEYRKASPEDYDDDDDGARSAKSSRRGSLRGNCHGCGEFGHRKSNCPN